MTQAAVPQLDSHAIDVLIGAGQGIQTLFDEGRDAAIIAFRDELGNSVQRLAEERGIVRKSYHLSKASVHDMKQSAGDAFRYAWSATRRRVMPAVGGLMDLSGGEYSLNPDFTLRGPDDVTTLFDIFEEKAYDVVTHILQSIPNTGESALIITDDTAPVYRFNAGDRTLSVHRGIRLNHQLPYSVAEGLALPAQSGQGTANQLWTAYENLANAVTKLATGLEGILPVQTGNDSLDLEVTLINQAVQHVVENPIHPDLEIALSLLNSNMSVLSRNVTKSMRSMQAAYNGRGRYNNFEPSNVAIGFLREIGFYEQVNGSYHRAPMRQELVPAT